MKDWPNTFPSAFLPVNVDAFYAGDRALGVADGVGGWADQGIDAVSSEH